MGLLCLRVQNPKASFESNLVSSYHSSWWKYLTPTDKRPKRRRVQGIYLCSYSSVREGGFNPGRVLDFPAFLHHSGHHPLYPCFFLVSLKSKERISKTMPLPIVFFFSLSAYPSVLKELFFCSLFNFHECFDQRGLDPLKATKQGKQIRKIPCAAGATPNYRKPRISYGLLKVVWGQAQFVCAKLHLCTWCFWVARAERAW